MEKFKPYVEKLAKYGCYSISAVYILVGLMAILSFLGLADDDADEERIVNVILELPGGDVFMALIIVGLIGYIIWRVFEAYTDPYDFGNDKEGIAKRTGIALSAGGYALIAFAAAEILIQGGGGNGEEDQQSMVAQVLGFPGGAWLVGLAGVITGFAGLVQFKYVAGGDYFKRINLHNMPDWLKTTTHVLAWAGYFARGIILAIIGYFLISAGIQSDPEEVGDTDTAFDFIGSFGTIGHIIFHAVALGTIGYGLFMIINGYYYSFEKDSEEED
jgi:hypothetical protein